MCLVDVVRVSVTMSTSLSESLQFRSWETDVKSFPVLHLRVRSKNDLGFGYEKVYIVER